jgi:hypothetical protein
MANYTIYPGKFICKECKVEVNTLRCYPETQTLTWMCKEKHLTSVKLGKRKRSDFDGEE